MKNRTNDRREPIVVFMGHSDSEELSKDRLRAVSLFSWSVEQNARDTQMTTRVTEAARRERHEKRETTRKAREDGLSRSSDFLA